MDVPPIRASNVYGVGESHRRRLQLVVKAKQRAKRSQEATTAAATTGGTTATNDATTSEADAAMRAVTEAANGIMGKHNDEQGRKKART